MDPYWAGVDPYSAAVEPYPAGVDPDSAGVDPNPAGVDPYPAGVDTDSAGVDPYPSFKDPDMASVDPDSDSKHNSSSLSCVHHVMSRDDTFSRTFLHNHQTNYMVLISDGNSEHVAHVQRNWGLL